MPISQEERNFFDVLGEVVGRLPGKLKEQSDLRNRSLLLNLENAKSLATTRRTQKRQSFLDRLKLSAEGRQQTLFEERFDVSPTDEAPIAASKALTASRKATTAQTLRETELLTPEDPQKATKALIDKLVGARGAKTKDVRGIENIDQPGFFGSFFGLGPDTTFTEKPEKVPFGAQELKAFEDSLNAAFGITPGASTQPLTPEEEARRQELKRKHGR